MASVIGKTHLAPEITGKYRLDEVRHCFADVRRAEKSLGHWSSVDIDTQLEELVEWVASQTMNEKMGKKTVQLGMTP
jgi:dTDP-L-rhamnose 4-epimerase